MPTALQCRGQRKRVTSPLAHANSAPGNDLVVCFTFRAAGSGGALVLACICGGARDNAARSSNATRLDLAISFLSCLFYAVAILMEMDQTESKVPYTAAQKKDV